MRTPRQVHLSRELVSSAKYAEHRDAVDAIVKKMRAGEGLTPHLSRGTKTAYVPTGKREVSRGRHNLDRLIADWNIHHLHLGLTLEADGYVTRTEDLLFGHFASDDAYLIGVFPHGSWAALEIAEITMRNWREAQIFLPLHGVIGLEQSTTDQERLDLRNGGVTSLLKVDGEVCIPAQMGQSMAGTPMWAAEYSNPLMHALRELGDAPMTASQLVVEQNGEEFRVRDVRTGDVVLKIQIIG